MINWCWLVCIVIGGLFFANCSNSIPEVEVPPVVTDRVIQFSGIDWVVRATKDKKEGPGPNLFSASDKNVWVDTEGRLHLKIREEAGYWYCSGVTARRSLGYGKYTFYVNSDITKLDKNVVVGLFTYLDDDHEIDIEFSKWSIDENFNAQFVSQPSTVTGNKERFDILPNLGPTVHSFDWSEEEIAFSSSFMNDKGHEESIYEWIYKGNHVPKKNNEKLKLNLWLFKGQMPADLKEQEIVIDSVHFAAA
ncbi:glycoside hydrolase family 16 protein [Sphingobacterium paucimobilis]|uniref:GH16 domain-containing protein n=1 Tax=Sphingobacterium paucimobilis HER1398 TaxID=1346330 RepID=U2J658_9SPHI|nr:glycoside hydrolase family 16 protein [Sphingobacterium paucimobilis]ERJ58123.1 hypothetical protein M472_05030 [Sphingobacterium paucimobilis HER1398]